MTEASLGEPMAFAGRALRLAAKSKFVRDSTLIYVGYCFRFVSPLLLYPLLTRTLGLDGFGLYATAYSLALTLSVVVEYGFNLSGTRDVALSKTSRERGEIASKITAAKALLAPVAALLGWGASLMNSTFVAAPGLISLSIVLGIGQGATAFWYFQGVRKILTAVSLEIGGALAALVGIVLMVHRPADVGMALAMQLVGAWVSVALGTALMFREAPAQPMSLWGVLAALRDGFPLFITRAAITIYTSASVFILGMVAGAVQAALYGAVERVTSALISLYRPLSAIVMPRVAVLLTTDRGKAFRLARIVLAGSAALFCLAAAVVALGAPMVVHYAFGSRFSGAAGVLQILVFTLPIIAVSQVLGVHLMVPLRFDRTVAVVIVLGGLVNLALALALGRMGGAMGMAWARLGTEAFITAAYAFGGRAVLSELFPKRSRHVTAI